MQHSFDCLSERLEWLLSTWFGAAAYGVLCAASYWLWSWDGVDRFVYLSGAVVIVLLIGAGRRDSKAAQAKLDTLTPGHALDRIEERAEREIEEARA